MLLALFAKTVLDSRRSRLPIDYTPIVLVNRPLLMNLLLGVADMDNGRTRCNGAFEIQARHINPRTYIFYSSIFHFLSFQTWGWFALKLPEYYWEV